MASELKPVSYKYKAIDRDGERVEGKMSAAREEDVLDALRRAGMVPLGVQRGDRMSLNGDVMASIRGDSAAKMNTGQLAAFTRQLNQLLKAGIPITQALQSLAEDPPSEAVGNVLQTVSDRLVAGSPLSEAFDGFPKVFNEVFVAYMAAGEASGSLDEVTERLAVILDKRAEITRKVKAVSMYPAMVASIIILMVSAIVLFIVPQYASIYESLDAELPGPTKLVVALSTWFPVVAAVIAAIVVGLVVWNKSLADDLDTGVKIDKAKFKLPIFGKLFKRLVLFRFTSTMGGALASGVQAYDAIDLSARASASRWLRSVSPDLRKAIQEGRPLTHALAEHEDLFSPQVRKMISTGEETGDLATMFGHAADALSDEVDLQISTMSAKIEVAMLVFMGFAVGSILIALYLPIINLTLTAGNKYGF